MKWTDLQLHPNRKMLRQFAAAWLVAWLLLAGRLWVQPGRQQVALLLAGVAVGIGGLGWVRPDRIRWCYVAAMVLAFPIGWLVSQLVLALIFYGLITPLALVFRGRGRDPLQRARPASDESLWRPKASPADVRRYFRQY